MNLRRKGRRERKSSSRGEGVRWWKNLKLWRLPVLIRGTYLEAKTPSHSIICLLLQIQVFFHHIQPVVFFLFNPHGIYCLKEITAHEVPEIPHQYLSMYFITMLWICYISVSHIVHLSTYLYMSVDRAVIWRAPTIVLLKVLPCCGESVYLLQWQIYFLQPCHCYHVFSPSGHLS